MVLKLILSSSTPIAFLIFVKTLCENKLGNPVMNFSFQKDLVESDRFNTWVRNISLYHLKSEKVGHLKLVRNIFEDPNSSAGFPTKCVAIVTMKKLAESFFF